MTVCGVYEIAIQAPGILRHLFSDFLRMQTFHFGDGMNDGLVKSHKAVCCSHAIQIG
jgi:hypothetical protein